MLNRITTIQKSGLHLRNYRQGQLASLNRKIVCIALLCLGCFLPMCASRAEDLSGLDRGHRLLIQHGLQLLAAVDRDLTNTANWENSNFTTIQFTDFQASNGGAVIGRISDLAQLPDAQWSRVTWSSESHPNVVNSFEMSNLPRLTMLQYRDEQNLGISSELALATSTLASWRTLYPDAIGYTNQWGEQLGLNTLFNYMLSAQPDMLFYDRYVFAGGQFTNDDERARMYRHMRKYRDLGLLGNDLSGDTPIPVGMWTQTFEWQGYTAAESETNLQYFGAFAFGFKALSAFTYNRPIQLNGFANTLFDGANTQATSNNGLPFDTDPLPMYDDIAEANRQAQNIGPALVRLLSTDIRVIPGVQFNGSPNDTANMQNWDALADPYITSISAVNNGIVHNGNRGDVIVGYFEPILDGFSGDDDTYFMVVNGLTSGGMGSAETEQTITLGFDFGTSGIDSLQRLSRDTGQIELIDDLSDGWSHLGGALYQLDLILGGGIGDLFKFNTGNAFVGIPVDNADFDEDGDVDGADFLVWQRGFGTTSGATLGDGDANADGAVDAVDLAAWQSLFSASPPTGTSLAVPEPSALGLILLVMAGMGFCRYKTN